MFTPHMSPVPGRSMHSIYVRAPHTWLHAGSATRPCHWGARALHIHKIEKKRGLTHCAHPQPVRRKGAGGPRHTGDVPGTHGDPVAPAARRPVWPNASGGPRPPGTHISGVTGVETVPSAAFLASLGVRMAEGPSPPPPPVPIEVEPAAAEHPATVDGAPMTGAEAPDATGCADGDVRPPDPVAMAAAAASLESALAAWEQHVRGCTAGCAPRRGERCAEGATLADAYLRAWATAAAAAAGGGEGAE